VNHSAFAVQTRQLGSSVASRLKKIISSQTSPTDSKVGSRLVIHSHFAAWAGRATAMAPRDTARR
jgi:hypothetical protein